MTPIASNSPGRARLLPLQVALLLVSLLSGAAAAEPWDVEVTPFAGFHVGGSFEDNTTGAALDARDGAVYGVVLDLADTPETQYELYYGFQRTRITGGGTFGGDALFDLDVHYLHVGGTYLFPGRKVRPYIAGGLGATHFSPGGSGPGPKTYFSISLGGGAKIPVSARVGLRLEGRGFLTILPESTSIFCVSSGGAACRVSVQGDVFGQFLLTAGLAFSL